MEELLLSNELWALIRLHQWAALGALVIGAVVRLAKLQRLGAPWRRIPARWRPIVVTGLGIVQMVLERAAAGKSWGEAFAHGVISVAIAVLGHQVLIEALRGGRELGGAR